MFEIYSDEDINISMEKFPLLPKGWLLHTKVNSWSISKYKKYLLIFGNLLNNIQDNKLYAIPPSEKEEKWQMLFGFKDSGLRVGSYKIMEFNDGN